MPHCSVGIRMCVCTTLQRCDGDLWCSRIKLTDIALFNLQRRVDFPCYVFNVRQSYCARYSYRLDQSMALGWTSVRLSVCLSVCPSVTRWYCVKTTQPIVKLSSLPGIKPHDSSFLRTKLFLGIPMGTPPTGAVNVRGVRKSCNFRPISRYS